MFPSLKFAVPVIICVIFHGNPILASRQEFGHFPLSGPIQNCVPTREAVFRKNDYYANWTANFTSATISFHVVAATTGYVGFGLSNFTGMANSDIVIGGVFPNGTSYFADYYAVSNTAGPEIDPSQDWFLDSASENGTHTELSFHRAFDTGDPRDAVITNDLTSFIWAMGATDTLQAHGSANRNMYLVSVLNFPNCVDSPIREETLSDKYLLRWSVSQQSGTAVFHVVAQTTGYVGFGLSYAGSTMFIADLAIGGVYENGTQYFGDYHGIGFTTPVLDDSQDWFLSEAKANSTHTELEFWRKLNTDDFDHDSPITSQPVHVLWAIGGSDNIGYHFGDRGSKQVVLVEGNCLTYMNSL